MKPLSTRDIARQRRRMTNDMGAPTAPTEVAAQPGPSEPGLADLASQLVLRIGHLPSCGEDAEFAWDCTCDYAGFMERMGRVLAAADSAPGEGLDVERLARALAEMSNANVFSSEMQRRDPGDYGVGLPTVNEFAEAIARAYDRLADTRKPEDAALSERQEDGGA